MAQSFVSEEFGHGSTRQFLCFMWHQLVSLGGIQLVAALTYPTPLQESLTGWLSWVLPSPGVSGPLSWSLQLTCQVSYMEAQSTQRPIKKLNTRCRDNSVDAAFSLP